LAEAVMRRVLVMAILGAALLGGCVSMIESAYDDHARAECEREGAPRRGDCLDRVEQNRRDPR
jgi:hypothetical protein